MHTITATSVGVGLKPLHFEAILASIPPLQFFEIHPENYFVQGGKMHHYLEKIAAQYPLSFHGVGMSLGSFDGLDLAHLKNVKQLINRYDPCLVSEHIAWSRFESTYLNDLLPLPYNNETLDILSRNIDQAQTVLKRTLLIENPSTYVEIQSSTYSEVDFINKLLKKTGAQLLLDVNNVFVSAFNHGWDACNYIRQLNPETVSEIHLAGHSVESLSDRQICIDTHDSIIKSAVWDLYAFTLNHVGKQPTLIEWDGNLPEWNTLHQESQKARHFLQEASRITA